MGCPLFPRSSRATPEVVYLSRTELGRCLELCFEVVGRVVAERGMASLSVVVGDVVADFELGLGQSGKASAVE